MINKISIKGVTSYPEDKFTDLGPLKRINLIYGLNGSGKSTVGNYLQDITGNRYQKCQIDPPLKQEQIFVYNQRFVEKNFHQESHPGIFTLNEGNIEAKEKITELKASYDTAASEIERIIKKRAQIDEGHNKAATNYKEALWNIRLEFEKADLGACMKGSRQKEAFKDQLEKLPLPTGAIRSQKELSDAAKSLSSSDEQPLPALPYISFNAEDFESDPILAKVITPSGDSYLADLIQKLGNSDWVKNALPYLENSENSCPLCQQDLPHDFQNHVKSLFDKSYDEEVSKVAQLNTRYCRAADALEIDLELPAYLTSAIQSDADFIKAKGELKRLLTVNRARLTDKLSSVSKVVALEPTNEAVKQLNASIKAQKTKDDAYNLRLSKKDQLFAEVSSEVWQLMRKQADQIVITYKSAEKAYVKAVADLDAKKKELSDQKDSDFESIAEYQSQMTNVEESVKKINSAIASIGISGFTLKKTDGDGASYRLVREKNSNDVYKSLSEGEKTLITFLYFLELCSGSVDADKPVVLSDRVIVIDDPISSLSHNYVYEVAAHIYHRVLRSSVGFKQVVVLTHNLFFFHELLRNAPKSITSKYACFRVSKGAHSAIAVLGHEEIKNDYETYWQVLRDARGSKVHAAVLPNMMRNILEHYFGFIHKNDDLLKALAALEKDDLEFKPLYRYINRQSHGDAINVTDFGGWDADKMIEKFKGVFAKSGYPEHYTVMMNEAPAEQEGLHA